MTKFQEWESSKSESIVSMFLSNVDARAALRSERAKAWNAAIEAARKLYDDGEYECGYEGCTRWHNGISDDGWDSLKEPT